MKKSRISSAFSYTRNVRKSSRPSMIFHINIRVVCPQSIQQKYRPNFLFLLPEISEMSTQVLVTAGMVSVVGPTNFYWCLSCNNQKEIMDAGVPTPWWVKRARPNWDFHLRYSYKNDLIFKTFFANNKFIIVFSFPTLIIFEESLQTKARPAWCSIEMYRGQNTEMTTLHSLS